MLGRTPALVVACALVLAACGGDRLTESEYSTEVATLIQRMDSRLDAHAEALFSSPASVEGTRDYLAARVAGYQELVQGIEALDPPRV